MVAVFGAALLLSCLTLLLLCYLVMRFSIALCCCFCVAVVVTGAASALVARWTSASVARQRNIVNFPDRKLFNTNTEYLGTTEDTKKPGKKHNRRGDDDSESESELSKPSKQQGIA